MKKICARAVIGGLCLAVLFTVAPLRAENTLFPNLVLPNATNLGKSVVGKPRIHISPTNWARQYVDGRGMLVGKGYHPQSMLHAPDIKRAQLSFHSGMKTMRPRLRLDPAHGFPDAPMPSQSLGPVTFPPIQRSATTFPTSTGSTPFSLFDLTAAYKAFDYYEYGTVDPSKGTVLLPSTKQYAVFFDCTQSCWTSSKDVSYSWYGLVSNTTGSSTSVQTAISDLNASNLIKIANQYTGSTLTKSLYPLSGSAYVTKGWTSGSMITDSEDLQTALASYVNSNNIASGSIVHLFIPPGVSVCSDTSYADCYDPNDTSGATWTFCAYHSYATNETNTLISGTKTIYYTVEPYQWVEGCAQIRFSDVVYLYQAYAGGFFSNFTLQSPLDAMISTLSHEVLETITDPLPTGEVMMGWYNPAFGEIGDLCAPSYYLEALGDLGYVNPGIYKTTLNKTAYNIQLEYSNSAGSCVAQ